MRMTHDEPSARLLALPVELRLEVYSYLVPPCLIEGFTYDIGGLYLSCRQVRAEMEAEHVRKLRPLLMAKHRWERIVHFVPVLRIHLDTFQASQLKNTKVTLRIPILAPWLKESSRLEDSKSFRLMVENMRLVFDMPWSTLTLDFYTSSVWLRSFENIKSMFRVFFRILSNLANADKFVLQRTKRLVLLLPDDRSSPLREILEEFRKLFLFLRGLLRDSKGSARVRQAWSCGRPGTKGLQWHLVLDFEKDLERPEQALYRIDETGVKELSKVVTV